MVNFSEKQVMETGCKKPGNGDDMILIQDGYMIDPKSGKKVTSIS